MINKSVEILNKEFCSFMADYEKRLGLLNINLNDWVIDHICYRVQSEDEYHLTKKFFVDLSDMYIEKIHNGRMFNGFFLKEPFIYKDINIYTVELSVPGGSDNYKTGFQHIELATKKEWKSIGNYGKIKPLLFDNSKGENYIKWEDKIVLKLTKSPILVKMLSDVSKKVFVF